MNENPTFEAPVITDDDVRWACKQLGLPSEAFFGAAGTDPRHVVFKDMSTMDIAACPGSGKTTLLVAKLAALARHWNYRSRGICVLSHTNVARVEIEQKLGHTAVGHRLLAEPHFVGTIHSFANTFLAQPWLRSLGYNVKVIDTEACLARRWRSLPRDVRTGLEKNRLNENPGKILIARNAQFDVSESIPWGRGTLGKTSPTYQALVAACRASATDGYFCHEEMLMWARDLLEKRPLTVAAIRGRFPLLFVDECQDNDEEQATLLHSIFLAGNEPVTCQRFGDANQAIFNSVLATGPNADVCRFPQPNHRDLPNSHRFGQKIADIANPLGITPCGLKGNGPKSPLASGADAQHTVFLFRDQAGAQRVLDNFGALIAQTFSADEIRHGTFKAVGQVHTNKGDANFPGHIGHYWQKYNPALARRELRPTSFSAYVQLGVARAAKHGETKQCVALLAEATLRFAARITKHDDAFPRDRHAAVLKKLGRGTAGAAAYEKLLAAFAIKNTALAKDAWENEWKSVVKTVGEAVAGTVATADALRFLEWTELLPEAADTANRGQLNTYTYQNGAINIPIQLGSIHSVKGETHTATLVVETYYHEPNIASIIDWLLGKNAGWKKGKRNCDRLKLHYVAMTRPSHLLCLALPFDVLASNGTIDAAKTKLLEERGWRITEV